MNIIFNPENNPRYKLDDIAVPGVTTITGIMPKVWMGNWVAKEVITKVMEFWKAGMIYNQTHIDEYCGIAKKAHRTKSDRAADKGTAAHNWFEKYVESIIKKNKPL